MELLPLVGAQRRVKMGNGGKSQPINQERLEWPGDHNVRLCECND